MKQKRLAKLLTLAMSFDLMVSPLIPVVRAETSKPSTAQKLNSVINTIGQVYSQVSQQAGNQNMSQMNNDMSQLQSQRVAQPDKYFNFQKLAQIPGLQQYIAQNPSINSAQLNCPTLPTTLYEARPEVCRIGITTDRGINPALQTQQMYAYSDAYFQIEKQYNNYSEDSNSDGQGFGIGCMNNAMNILNGFFKYRVDELDKMVTLIEGFNNQFREDSRPYLDNIEDAVAQLDGNSEIADKVRTRNPALLDFKKRFNNPACNSMFAGERLNDLGREGGLNAMKANISDTISTPGKNGKYSGESYSKLHTAVVEDINNLANKVSKQFELNFDSIAKDPQNYNRFLSGLPGMVSSSTGSNQALSADLFADAQTAFNTSYITLNKHKNNVLDELRKAQIDGDTAGNLLSDLNATTFGNEINAIENRIKNKCFEANLRRVNKDKILGNIIDPNASKHANKYASNYMKDKLNEILDDNQSSLDRKLTLLKELDANVNNRYYLKIDRMTDVEKIDNAGGRKTDLIKANSRRTPGMYFTELITNCNDQFKATKLSENFTGASAIAKLRQLNTEFRGLASRQAAQMQQEVRKKLVECQSPEIANNTTPGSCTPDRFDTSSPGFCANAALSCSKNMQACSEQVTKQVQVLKDQKTTQANNYKNLMQKNKKDIVRLFDEKLLTYMKEAEALRATFGAGFTAPAGIKREVPEGERYLPEFMSGNSPDGRLLLEDPDKYVAMFKENIAALKQSVVAQQNQILGGDSVGKNNGLLADHIRKTKENYRKVANSARDLKDFCQRPLDEAMQAAKQQAAEQQKKMTELGEKQKEFCRRFSLLASGNPGPACKGNIEDMVSAIGTAARELEAQCDGIQNESNTNSISQAQEICLNEGIEPTTNIDDKVKEDSVVKTAQQAVDDAKDDYEDARAAKTSSTSTDAAVKKALDDDVVAKRAALRTAESTLATKTSEARTRIAGANPAPSTGNSPSRLAAACRQFTECDRDTGSTSTTTAGVKTGCDGDKLNSKALLVLRVSDKIPPVPSAESAPAICNAGDNSGRGIGGEAGGFMNGFMNALGSARQ